MKQRRFKVKTVPATTNNITKGIVNFLLSKGHSASRVNTQGQYDESLNGGAGGWRKSGSRKGFLDISACLKTRFCIGLYLAIDVKKGNDKLSQDQIYFMDEVKAAGGEVFEASTLGDFITWYSEYLTEKYL